MGFFDAIENAMQAWFSTDFADSVTLNGDTIQANVKPSDTETSADGIVDYLDVEFQLADYPAVVYRTDALIYSGETWRYPIVLTQDSYTKTVRFSRNKRPIARTR